MTNKKGIKNAGLLSGGLSYVPTNEPLQFSDKQYQYLESESKAFIQQYAKYSTDFVEAVAEGLNPNNPTETLKVRMRMSNIVKNSASTTKQIDDYKIILLESRKLCYIPAGTKFVTMGSTWLCVNSNNISNGDGSCIVQRCNAVWKHYDYYGNVLSGSVIAVLIAYSLQSLSSLLLGWLPGFLGQIPFLQIGLPAILSLYFDIFSGCMQAYIFAMLTMLNISGGFAQEDYEKRKKEKLEKKNKKLKSNT